MKRFRSVLVGIVVIACFFLCGFKKPHQHHESLTKKPPSLKSEKSQQKPLDLTIPVRDLDSQESPEPLTLVQHGAASETLIDDKKDADSAIELKGNVIMSQEPEAGKTKHADGAGLMINLHH
jgi:hypothetical protein